MAMPGDVKEVALLLCDRIVREAETNKAQLQGVFQQIFLPTVPGGLNAALFIRFRVDPPRPSHPVDLFLSRPNGIQQRIATIPMVASAGLVEGAVQLQGLPIMQFGRHTFSMHVPGGGDELGSVSFEAHPVPGTDPKQTGEDRAN
jgi:hypothetical protein